MFTCTDDQQFANRVIFAVRFVVYFVIGFGFIHLDFFGLSTRTEQLSQDVFNLLLSPFYEGTHDPDTAKERGITVVLMDDDTLEEQEFDWPVNYLYHAQIIGNILEQCPRQLFIDFRFVRTNAAAAVERAHFDQYLGGVLRNLKKEDCPGLFDEAGGIDNSKILYAVRDGEDVTNAPVPQALKDNARPVAVSWVQQPGFYPMRVTDKAPRNFSTDRADSETVALAMYRNMPGGPDAAVAAKDFIWPMAVRWGVELDPSQKYYFPTGEPREEGEILAGDAVPDPDAPSDGETGENAVAGDADSDSRSKGDEKADRRAPPDCRLLPADFPGRLGAALGLWWDGVLSVTQVRDPRPVQPCPFILSIPAAIVLFRDYHDQDLTEKGAVIALQDRSVLYGFDVSASPDHVQTVMHGRVSGVYKHAQALDNLATYDKRYFRSDPVVRFWLETVAWVALVLTFCIRQRRRDATDVAERLRGLPQTRGEPGRTRFGPVVDCLTVDEWARLADFGRTLLVLAVTVVALIALCMVMRVAVADIVGLAAMRGLLVLVQQFGLIAAFVTLTLRALGR